MINRRVLNLHLDLKIIRKLDRSLQPDHSLKASAGFGMSEQIFVVDRNREFISTAADRQNVDPVQCIGF